MRHLALTLAIILTGYFLSAQQPDYKPFPEWEWGKEDSTEYMLYSPPNLEPGKKYPIALFMHGCCGQDLKAGPRNAVDPPARMWHQFGANEQEIPTYIISAKTNRGWSKHFESLKKVMDFLVEKRQGDSTRIYVTGFSMGGRGTFEFISKYPNYFAAAMPMGMSFFDGDFDKIKHVPIWTNQGSTDWWSRELYKFVKETRTLNGLELDSAWEWVTGVNPIYTSFKGVGHGVQWHAASTQDLTGWAYTKVNDGNQYPQVYFTSPNYREEAEEGKKFKLDIVATDPDGTIEKIDFYLNKKFHSSITKAPYRTNFKPVSGDNILEAIAYDDKGKQNKATTILVVDSEPAIQLKELPYARVGSNYEYWLPAIGNGTLTFSSDKLPEGLILLEDGLLRGYPIEPGKHQLEVTVQDIDGDEITASLNLEIKPKRAGEVLVTNAKDVNGSSLPVSKVVYNETPNFEPEKDPSSFIEEINFSNPNRYYGLTFIKTNLNDSTSAEEEYLTFDVDQDVEVLVGYEKLDYLNTSTIPDWLNEFKIARSEVVTQFRYFGVYSKDFEKGTISLPGGDKKGNNMAFNYFVMVRPKGFDNKPEINMSQLPDGALNTYYQSSPTALYGHGKLIWKVVDGQLPEGLTMNEKGLLSGIPIVTGDFKVTLQVEDAKEQTDQKEVKLRIE